jgi:hypothetical protein
VYHNHSPTNGSYWISENSSFRSTGRGTSGATRFSIVVQTNAAFARSVLDAIRRLVKTGLHGVSIKAVASQSDEEKERNYKPIKHLFKVYQIILFTTNKKKKK